jgi:ABC-type dipeptide/oligopeptide/nickel transport system permease component
MVMGVVLAYSAVLVLLNTAADLALPAIDPRLRVERSS